MLDCTYQQALHKFCHLLQLDKAIIVNMQQLTFGTMPHACPCNLLAVCMQPIKGHCAMQKASTLYHVVAKRMTRVKLLQAPRREGLRSSGVDANVDNSDMVSFCCPMYWSLNSTTAHKAVLLAECFYMQCKHGPRSAFRIIS